MIIFLVSKKNVVAGKNKSVCFKQKKMENSLIKDLMEIATSPQKIDDFVYFCYALHERTGCKGRKFNLDEMVKSWLKLLEETVSQK